MQRVFVFLPLLAVASLPSLAHAAGDPVKGATIFSRCSVCHSVETGKKSVMGPNLGGVVGRKAGTAKFTYSPAMKAAALVWTADNLDAFLKRPSGVVKGTRMAFAGMPNAQDREDVIAYLKSKK